MNTEDVTPGKNTTEFYVTVATNIINAILMILITLGLLTQEQSTIWQGLIGALILAVLPLATMIVNKEYTKGRTAVKLGAMGTGSTITLSPSVDLTAEEEAYVESQPNWLPAADRTRPEASE